MSSTATLERKETGIIKQGFEFPKIPEPKKITEVDIGTAVKDVIRKADEERLSTNANTSLLSSAAVITEGLRKTPLEKARDALRLSLKKPALITSALAIMSSSGCFIPNPFSKSQEVSPTPVVVPKKDLPISAPPQELTPEPKVISIIGSGEADHPTNRSAREAIKFIFPEGVVGGKSPLIPQGDTLSVSFKLKSDIGVSTTLCGLSLADLFNKENLNYNMEVNPTIKGASLNLLPALITSQSDAKFSMSKADEEMLREITLRCANESNGDVVVDLLFPNKQIIYNDKYGRHSINPAESFASGKVGLSIKRGDTPGRFPLTVKDINISNGKEELVAKSNGFEIIPPDGTVPTKTPEATQMPVKPPTPTIQPTKAPTPNPKEEENKWTRKWAPNETVSVREWWDDMVSKGYISIDSIAQRYAGKEINSFLASANLVPNPVEYYKTGYGFLGTCKDKLDGLVKQGQGHITITSDAYAQIPGANDCFVVTNKK